MARKIIFRAWYKGDKQGYIDSYTEPRMYHNVQELYDGQGFDGPLGGMSCFASLLDDDRFIVEQFTGIHDKNGTMIFEGDILKRDTDQKPKFVFLVEGMNEGAYGGVTLPFRNHYLTLEMAMKMAGAGYVEVIGNIHENQNIVPA